MGKYFQNFNFQICKMRIAEINNPYGHFQFWDPL